MAHASPDRISNRLAAEPSPYLQQHAQNPVDWWPWDDAAFAEARRRDVPVFLSIGYATCHWCHVMAHESFEDETTAQLLNDAFVCVKVDREERPDVDDVYMAVCQMMTGSGGWPLTLLLTPDRKPFFAATYIPRASRFGRMGLQELVPRVVEAWRTQRAELETQADHLLQHLRGEVHEHGGETHQEPAASAPAGKASLGLETLEAAATAFAARFDETHGGFGGAPKFPSPVNLLFLLRQHHRTGDALLLRMVEAQLSAMARGGIRDHLGGGFHRYSTDAGWLLPHFEKMLYDQALLAMAYTEAFQVTQDASYAEVARDILDYVLRDLRDPAGGFRSAEDADSEGVEGKFYVWTRDEALRVLGTDDGPLFCRAYGVEADGNFNDEATHRKTGANVLHLPRPLPEVAKDEGISLAALEKRLGASRSRLLAARGRRVQPLLDDKILADWNGLAVAALARASWVLGEPRYQKAAKEAARFVAQRMKGPDGRVRHMWKGAARSPSFLDDHAFLLWGLLELYEADFDPAHLAEAAETVRAMERHFSDPAGGFFPTPHDGEALPARRKEAYDGAVPSGNGISAWCLLRLSRLTGEARWEELAARTFEAFSPGLVRHPAAFPSLLVALDFALGPVEEALVAGRGAEALLDVLQDGFRPRTVTLRHGPGLAAPAPWTKAYPADGPARAYVCRDHACQAPVADVAALRAALS